MKLSIEEKKRYQRHLRLAEIGKSGQLKLKTAKVLCVGAGGLGSASLPYLAAAGVGTIGIIDSDIVEISNLQRQIIYKSREVREKKSKIAAKYLCDLNPEIQIDVYDERLNEKNILTLIRSYDIVVDGTDNFFTHYLINDACFHLNKPNVQATVLRFVGQISVFTASHGPCYRCLFPQPPSADKIPNCSMAGVLGVLPGILGNLQAVEVIKWIVGIGESLVGRLLVFDALAMSFREFEINKDLNCLLCGKGQPFDEFAYSNRGCDMNTIKIPEISVEEFYSLREKKEDFILLDVREQQEYNFYNLGGKLIPLAELDRRINELDVAKKIIVHCKAGYRGAQAVRQLQALGFKNVFNLEGGIEAWMEKYDTENLC